ncbi:hypothetical protein PAPHI01_0319 [Pancytospora philotis]|nr:hypothetical protein PAPHI01_0319 [Pancytospora philotis]
MADDARAEPWEHFIVTKDALGLNSALLTPEGGLKPALRRTTDYMIVPRDVWLGIKDNYDVEIPTRDVYHVCIFFKCHGESQKRIFVHGVEKVFDVVLTLFVNKIFGLDAFRRMFVVKHGAEEIDPMVSFEWFRDRLGDAGDARTIYLSVERQAAAKPPADSPVVSFRNSAATGDYEEVSTTTESSNNTEMYVEPSKKASCVGLPNLGNTCFMNSAIQCILSCEEFRRFFIAGRDVPQDDPLVVAWQRLVEAMHTHATVPVRAFKSAMGDVYNVYKSFDEQDSFEFINCILEHLHEKLKAPATNTGEEAAQSDVNNNEDTSWGSFIRDNDSIVSRTFYGLSTAAFTCKRCGHQRQKTDPFMTLSPPIPSEAKHHPSVTVVFESGRIPMKIVAPADQSIADLVASVQDRYAVTMDLMPVEYSGEQLHRRLSARQKVSAVGPIVLFEHARGKAYVRCTLSTKRLFFFREKCGLDFIVPKSDSLHETKVAVYKKLEPYLAHSFSVEEFYQFTTLEWGATCPVFETHSLNLHFSNLAHLFDKNLQFLKIGAEERSPITLAGCLDMLLREEEVMLTCDECNLLGPHAMHSTLTKLPSILIIQLKRFSYARTNAKIDTLVDFPIDCFILNGHRYRLLSTCNHVEIGMGYGHYLAYVFRDGRWHCCNDSVISKCKQLDKRSAYIFFYQLVS